jgi:hypothetical protein
MSDVKRFTGFIAIDGSTHTSQKSAVDHSRVVKVASALDALAEAVLAFDVTSSDVQKHGIASSDVGNVIHAEDLPFFLAAHREQIMAAFTQDVLTRKKRAKKTAVAAADAVA